MVTPITSAPTPDRASQRLVVLAALITVFLWASAFVGIRMIGTSYSPGALAFGRIAVGTLALGAVALRYRRPLPSGRALAFVIAYGIAWFAGYNVVLNLAELHLDAGTAALLVNIAPILVAVFAGLFLGEGFPRPLIIGISIAFAGVVLIGVGGSGANAGSDQLGLALGLLTALLYAGSVLMQKVVLRHVDALTATFLGCAIGAVALLPFAPEFVDQTSAAPASALAGVIYLGLFPTAIAFTTWAYALARTNAGRLTATTLAVPAITIGLSWVFLGELPTTLGMLGGALCLLGVAISRRQPRTDSSSARQVGGDRVVTEVIPAGLLDRNRLRGQPGR